MPAKVLTEIEASAGEAIFRAHPAQLLGPLAGGRLSACFGWGVQWPWQLPLELGLKAVLGVYFAVMLPGEPQALQTAEDGLTRLLVLHLSVIALLLLVAVHTIAYQHYSHFADNFTIAASQVAVAAAIALRLFGHLVPKETPAVAAALAATALVLVTLAVAAAVALLVGLVGRLQVQSLEAWMLADIITGWGGRCEKKMPSVSDDPVMTFSCTSWPGRLHSEFDVDVEISGFSDEVPRTAVTLPGELHVPTVHRSLLPAAEPGCAESVGDCDERPRLPLPARLFLGGFSMPRLPGEAPRGALPLAALLTERESRLVYQEPEYNGGCGWKDSIRDFFAGHEACIAEVEKLVESHPTLLHGGGVAVVDVLPVHEMMEPARSFPSFCRGRRLPSQTSELEMSLVE